MKKIRITFKISQKLSGEIKTVNVVGRSIDDCWNRIHTAFKPYHSFSFEVLNVCETTWEGLGFWQADSQTIVSYKNVSSVMCGAALFDNSEPCQNH